MALILENETWNQADIAPEFQSIAKDMITPPPKEASLFQGLQTPPTKKRLEGSSLRNSQPNPLAHSGASPAENSAKRSNSLENRTPPDMTRVNGESHINNNTITTTRESNGVGNDTNDTYAYEKDKQSPPREAPTEKSKGGKREVEEKAQMAEALDINGRQFHVVIAALMLLKTLSEYLNVLSLLPALNTDILPKYVYLTLSLSLSILLIYLSIGWWN